MVLLTCKGVSVFGFFHPRTPDFILGVALGLTFALACHWVAWAFH